MLIANVARAFITTAAGATLAVLAQGFKIEADRLNLRRTVSRPIPTSAAPIIPVASPKRRTHWPKR